MIIKFESKNTAGSLIEEERNKRRNRLQTINNDFTVQQAVVANQPPYNFDNETRLQKKRKKKKTNNRQ